MTQTPAEWLQSHAEQAFARQRGQVDTAKLLSTFAAVVAATLVAAALQVGPRKTLDTVATVLLGLSVLAVIVIILLDRITEADQALVLAHSETYKWDSERLLQELRVATLTAATANKAVVNSVRYALAVQVALAIASGTVSAFSLLT